MLRWITRELNPVKRRSVIPDGATGTARPENSVTQLRKQISPGPKPERIQHVSGILTPTNIPTYHS